MDKFQNVNCPICQKPLNDTEQIVVCPDCGAPYHKRCIDVTGKCVFDDLHKQGKSWENPNKQQNTGADNNSKICANCGAVNPQSGLFCENCGSPLNNGKNAYSSQFHNGQTGFNDAYYPYGFNPVGLGMFASPFGNASPEEELNGIKVKDYALFIGQNMYYFIPKFKNMVLKIGRAGFNVAAMIFGGFYFIYRKMYLAGLLLLLWFAVLKIPDFLYAIDIARQTIDPSVSALFNQNQLEFLSLITSVPYYLTHILCGFFANKLYFNHSVRSIKKIESMNLSPQDYVFALRKKGGVMQSLILIVFLAYFLLCVVLASVLTYTM